MVERLNRIKGVRCVPSQGAFYAFPDFRQAIAAVGAKNDIEMAEMILEKTGVALVPGSAFGAEGYQRLSFATSMHNLNAALDRLEGLLGKA